MLVLWRRRFSIRLKPTLAFMSSPPKFALSLDAGEGLVMLEHPHDLWLSALDVDGETLLGFGLAGCPANDPPLAAVSLDSGLALVVAMLELFLEHARPGADADASFA
jgi:precorrin-3B synthase